MVDRRGKTKIVQVINYYPFGGLLDDTKNEKDVQIRKYGGKELDRMHGLNLYDFSARQYDPALCQFTSIDPLCEMYYHLSPYAYCGGDPVNFIDPTGMKVSDSRNAYTTDDSEEIRKFWEYMLGGGDIDKYFEDEADMHCWFSDASGVGGGVQYVDFGDEIVGFGNLPECTVTPSNGQQIGFKNLCNTWPEIASHVNNVSSMGLGQYVNHLDWKWNRYFAYADNMSREPFYKGMKSCKIKLKYLKPAAKYGGTMISIGITYLDGEHNGWDTHHYFDIAAAVALFGLSYTPYGLIANCTYIAADGACQYFYDRSLTECACNLFK